MNYRLVGFFLALFIFLFGLSVFKVDERETAVVLQFGKIKRVVLDSGLHFKAPFVENARFFDNRIQVLDSQNPERFITSEKKNINIDSFLKWRIVDPKLFLTTMSGNLSFAELRLTQTTNSALREEVGKFPVHDVISGQRDDIMKRVSKRADADARQFGVKIVDVRLRRVGFPPEVSDSVFRRMRAERERVAAQLRSQGFGEAESIRADADKRRVIILADAYRKAAEMEGQGDAAASDIYAKSFTKDPSFFRFYKSMGIYQDSFRDKSNILVLDPTVSLLKYFSSQKFSNPEK
ncbi:MULTISPECIES: protease modulator HflC [Candidatus Ichthyocystis]|uniref:Protein HflC n=1 Tax=Candidatus Ichthyocystis hellenicum TaxID=1561003 RepID=A0A0S4M3U7_9BURK|nr:MULTISPECIES: protease modulator HflC [Ichthyocystis]CUT17904.1 putative membrane protease subunit HflC [Candidatus Ichthyocystis hellenicum]